MRIVTRVLSGAFKVMGGLLALVLLVYVTVNLASMARGWQQRGALADEVTVVLGRVLPSAEQAQGELIDSVGREPDRQWIEQDCRFETDDSGWMVQSYRETCVMRSVTAWRVGSELEARGLVTARGSELPAYDGCVSLGVTGEPGVVEGPGATYVDPAASNDGPWCTHDLGTSDEGRVLVGDRAAIDKGPWLLLLAEQPLVDESIGCAHWSVLFCDNPWTGHAFGEAPSS